MSTPFEKAIEGKTFEELLAIGRQLFGFEEDELKSLAPTEAELRSFLLEANGTRGMISTSESAEDKLGWDEGKKHAKLGDSEREQLNANREAAKAELQRGATSAGTTLASPTEVKSEMRRLKELFSQPLDEEED